MPPEAIRAQNLVLAPCQLASCPFPILSLNENDPRVSFLQSSARVENTHFSNLLHPGPCCRASTSGRNERFREGQPGQRGHIHLDNHHPALKLALVFQVAASGSSPPWVQVPRDGGHRAEGLRNPEEPEATAGNPAPRHPSCARPGSQLSKVTWRVSKGQRHLQENAF